MVKKFKIFYTVAAIAIVVIIIGGILIYNFKYKKEIPFEIGKENPKAETGEEKIQLLEEEKETGTTSTPTTGDMGGTGGGGGGSGGGGGGGGGGAGGAAGTEYISDQTICQNAQTNDLCNGLDLAYGQGYRATCCSEHNSCC